MSHKYFDFWYAVYENENIWVNVGPKSREKQGNSQILTSVKCIQRSKENQIQQQTNHKNQTETHQRTNTFKDGSIHFEHFNKLSKLNKYGKCWFILCTFQRKYAHFN